MVPSPPPALTCATPSTTEAPASHPVTAVARPLRARLLLAALALAGPLAAAPLHAAPHALLVVDANTGATLIDQAGSEPRFPASLTKVMTLFMLLEAIEVRRVKPDARIAISARAAAAAPSKLDLDVGDTIAVEDAMKALVTKSANDVAIAVAEHLAGSEDAFARAMTIKARELGLTSTVFKNASGLPDPGQVTTARDMVTLGLALYDRFPGRVPLFQTRSFSYGGRTYRTHNTLMVHMPGVDGIKTGYTLASGFNLMTSYRRDGRHLMAAIFGGDTAGQRNTAMRLALVRALGRASTARTRKPLLVAAVRKPARPALRVPAPVPAVRPPAPAPVVPAPAVANSGAPAPLPEAAVAPAGAPIAPTPVSMAATAPPALPPKVAFARVRTIDVTRLAPIAPAEPTPAPTPVAASTAPIEEPAPPPLAAPLPPAPLPPVSVDGPATGAADPQPDGVAPTAPSYVSPRMPLVLRPPVLPPGAVGLGRPPSSLDAQHEAATAPPAADAVAPPPEPAPSPMPPPRVARPAPPAPAPKSTAGYEIQIGAYLSAAEAERRLALVAAQATTVLASRRPARRTATVAGKVYERARFTGFDQAAAVATCAELTRLTIPCMVVKAD
jgi:D-alanyl-D-alanine carboxypeptidase